MPGFLFWLNELDLISPLLCKPLLILNRSDSKQILTWMGSQGRFRMLGEDHSVSLDLVTKVHGLSEAEAYFDKLPNSTSKKAACLPLLHHHLKVRDVEKAEAFMMKLQNLGLLVNPEPFNEMMKLYIATNQCEKVPIVIWKMKRGRISLNVSSYNLWMNSSFEVSGISSVETIYKEMVNNKDIKLGWSTYATLAGIYTKAHLFDKAFTALRAAEERLSVKNRFAYFFLITHYASLNDRHGVLRLWELSKRVAGRMTCANYMRIMSSLLKVGDLEEAETVFRTWESDCRNYDIRVSNVLLGAYMRKGWMDKAESLHLSSLEKGGNPNYKTWEILMEGWVKCNKMEKAVDAMKKGFSMLEGCHWRPSTMIIKSIAEFFEKHGNVEDAKSFAEVLHSLNLMSLPLYKSLLKTHICARRPILTVLEMMERGKINLDEETCSLVEVANTINFADVS